jgi:hypothetical protein
MYIRVLAVSSLAFFLFGLAAASAEDVKIMGLMETHAARSDSKQPLAYLTGKCQKKHKRMKCHLNEIAVTNLITPTYSPEEVREKPRMPRMGTMPLHRCSRCVILEGFWKG